MSCFLSSGAFEPDTEVLAEVTNLVKTDCSCSTEDAFKVLWGARELVLRCL